MRHPKPRPDFPGSHPRTQGGEAAPPWHHRGWLVAFLVVPAALGAILWAFSFGPDIRTGSVGIADPEPFGSAATTAVTLSLPR
jgi:hypothetical protein